MSDDIREVSLYCGLEGERLRRYPISCKPLEKIIVWEKMPMTARLTHVGIWKNNSLISVHELDVERDVLVGDTFQLKLC